MNARKILTSTVLFTVLTGNAQGGESLTKEATAKVVSEYSELLKQVYFDTERAGQLEAALEKGMHDGLFNDLTPDALAGRITEMVRIQTSDKHFYVGFSQSKGNNPGESSQPEQKDLNGELAEVKILKGNIGYIKWTSCRADDEAFKAIVLALTRLEKCSSLIIDISENPGGDGRGCAFMNQYLYRDKSYQELLLKKCTGEADWHRSEEVYNYSSGPKLFDIPLYVIISGNTASSAEYFALTAQEMKRGKILGRTTAGAGNPVTMVSFGNYFAYIPICRIKTKSEKSIEGTGVKPDVLLSSDNLPEETLSYIHTLK
jgi:hypothetical protein